MLVKEFVDKRVDGFPSGFYESLPTVCLEDDCGYPTEMYETLTGLRCSNPRCPAKIAQRLEAMFTSLGIKGVGEVGFRAIVSAWNLRNPLFIFAYEPDDGLLAPTINETTSRSVYEQLQKKKSFTLAEYVRIANLPHIQTSSGAIFDKFDDINKAYEEIERGGIQYIQSRLGVSKDETSLRAIKVFDSLMTYKQDLIEAFDCVDIIRKNGGMLNFKVCVSQAVECGFKTKAEFYNAVNSIAPDKLYVEFLGSATKDIDYLVWAGTTPSRKVNTVKKRNENGGNTPILNATEFIAEMKRLVDGIS